MDGWVCPTCRRSLAPSVRECPHCNPLSTTPRRVGDPGDALKAANDATERPFATSLGEPFTHGGARR